VSKELAELRKRLKKKNPEFRRHLWHRFIKFQNQDAWRKPKGNDNKMRLQLKGYPPIVKIGYRNPRIIRGLHPTGLLPAVVNCVKDLENLDPKKHIIYIGGTVGLKKRIEIVKAAREKGFVIANAGGL